MVANLPFRAVVDGDVFWELDGFGKVNQPHVRVVSIMDEQKRTTDHLKKSFVTINQDFYYFTS